MGDANGKEMNGKEMNGPGTLQYLRGIWDRIVALKYNAGARKQKVPASGDITNDLPTWGLVSIGEYPRVAVCERANGTEVTVAFVYYWATRPGPECVPVTRILRLVADDEIPSLVVDLVASPAAEVAE